MSSWFKKQRKEATKWKCVLWRNSKKKKMQSLKKKSSPSRQIKKGSSVKLKCNSKFADQLRLTAPDLRIWKLETRLWWNFSLIRSTEFSSESNKTIHSIVRSWSNWWYKDSSSSTEKILSSLDASKEIYLLAKLSLKKLFKNTKIYWSKRWIRKLN